MFILVQIINLIYWVYFILIFARFVFSWVRPDPYNSVWGPLMRITYQATEPLLAPIRRVLPSMGGLDFSPLILLLGLGLLRNLLIGLLV
ncbi:MAG: YggT family protein [Candidatus Promineifilaceae bacterium]